MDKRMRSNHGFATNLSYGKKECTIMFEPLYLFIAAFTASMIGLCFVRVKPVPALGLSFAAALLSLVLAFLFDHVKPSLSTLDFYGGTALFLLALSALLFLSVSLASRFWLRVRWDEALLLFLLASGAFAVLSIPVLTSEAIERPLYGIRFFFTALFLILVYTLKPYFPEKDWQGLFRGPEEEELPLRLSYMYLLPGLSCLLLWAVTLAGPTGTLAGGLCLMALGGIVFWLTLLLMILLPAYEAKHSAVTAEQQYRGEMQSFMNVIRSQRHDYNFHVQTIAGLIRQGKVDECLRYVDALEEDTTAMNTLLPVKDPAISAMIHHFRIMAAQKGIHMDIDMQYDLSQIATNVYETNKILSNLLQNAIDETASHADKSYGIGLLVLKRGEFCVIRVSNKLSRAPEKEELGQFYREGYTTKEGHDGVGLSSLKTLLTRYHGTIYTELDNDVIRFVARVPIDYAKEIPSF